MLVAGAGKMSVRLVGLFVRGPTRINSLALLLRAANPTFFKGSFVVSLRLNSFAPFNLGLEQIKTELPSLEELVVLGTRHGSRGAQCLKSPQYNRSQ